MYGERERYEGGTGTAIRGSTVSNRGVTLSNFEIAGGNVGIRVWAGKVAVKVVRSTIPGNAGHGIDLITGPIPERAKLGETAIVNNGLNGVLLIDGSIRAVKSSSTTANGTDATCGVSEACADLAAGDQPIIDATSTCDTSYIWNTGVVGSNWGIYSLD